MKRTTIAALALAALTGCSERSVIWIERQEPTTDAERQAVAKHVESVLSHHPYVVQDDQDWEDTVNAVYHRATEALCRLVLGPGSNNLSNCIFVSLGEAVRMDCGTNGFTSI